MKRSDPVLVICFGGAAGALLGLAWDVSNHLANPTLASHESPVDIFSPSHDLIAIGIVVAAAASAWLLARNLSRPVGFGAIAVVLISFGWMAYTVLNVPPEAKGTPQQEAAAADLWQATDLATRRYASLSAALADGYLAFNPIADPLVHYIMPAYMHDGRILDPDHVESLLYENTMRGPVLVAAMYSLEDPNAAPPDVAGEITTWHRHDDLCFTPDGEVVGAAPDCPPGSATYYTPWMLHVWLVPNRYGRFAADFDSWNELRIELTG